MSAELFEDPPLPVIQGSIERVTYHAVDTHWCVLRVMTEPGLGDPTAARGAKHALVTAVGTWSDPAEGLRVRLGGSWSAHQQHGRQFQFETLELLPPGDPEGVVRYLSSNAFKGVGEVLARRIVDRLGLAALETIRTNPERLAGIRGLRAEVRQDLVRAVHAQASRHKLRAFLAGLGLGPHQAELVAEKYGDSSAERLSADPYLLSTGITGIGFLTADRVAKKLGVPPDSPGRARAALWHALEESQGDGHTCLGVEQLFEDAGELTRGEIPRARFEEALGELERSLDVAVEENLVPATARAVYSGRLHAAEIALAERLARLLAGTRPKPWAGERALDDAALRIGIALHPLQREAVLGLLAESVAILSGGPGVGKTTIIRLVVELAEASGARVLLASPTGRAAKRLSEATGRAAQTIHRLLGHQPGQGFEHDRRRPLEADLVIVDEVSMLDVSLARHLVDAIRPPTRLVLVGDPDQLPAVMPGNVLADLIASKRVPLHRLSQVFRQSERSLIVENAHRILAGEAPEFSEPGPGGEFYFFPAEDPAEAARLVVDVASRRIPERFGLDWLSDVQVLAPMYRGECGVDALNQALRHAAGFGGRELHHLGQVWREGDRVIQTRNDYDMDVFNGDVGRVLSVDPEARGLVVRYPERDVAYGADSLGDLQPAFAITVHRAQGSEYPAVVFPLVTQHYMMLQRHLLYTAVTRARRLVVLVGQRRALQMAIENAEQRLRLSGLAARLARAVGASGAERSST